MPDPTRPFDATSEQPPGPERHPNPVNPRTADTADFTPGSPGATATYTVKRAGAAKDLTATLGAMPDEVYNAWFAEHMKEHTAVASN